MTTHPPLISPSFQAFFASSKPKNHPPSSPKTPDLQAAGDRFVIEPTFGMGRVKALSDSAAQATLEAIWRLQETCRQVIQVPDSTWERRTVINEEAPAQKALTELVRAAKLQARGKTVPLSRAAVRILRPAGLVNQHGHVSKARQAFYQSLVKLNNGWFAQEDQVDDLYQRILNFTYPHSSVILYSFFNRCLDRSMNRPSRTENLPFWPVTNLLLYGFLEPDPRNAEETLLPEQTWRIFDAAYEPIGHAKTNPNRATFAIRHPRALTDPANLIRED
jgi:hypothetical protein